MKTSRAELLGFFLSFVLVACGPADPDAGSLGPESPGPESPGPEQTGPEQTGPEQTGPEQTGPGAEARRLSADSSSAAPLGPATVVDPRGDLRGDSQGDEFTPPGVALAPPPTDLGPRPAEFAERERELLERDFPEQHVRVSTLRKRLSLAPTDALLRAELGETLYGMDLPRLAERELLLALAADPEAAQVHLLLGDVYRARSEHGRALWHLERARALDPGRHEPWQFEAMVVRELGDSASAARLVDAGLARVPGQSELLVLRARLHDDLGEPEAAEGLLRDALEQVPDHLRAHLLLAQVLVRLGREEEAARENTLHGRLVLLDRAGALDLDRPLREAQRAAVLASHHNLTGRLDLAQVELARSYELEPDNADARVVEGALLRNAGREREALELFEAALRTDPGHTRARKNLALLLLQAEDPALRDAPRALDIAKRTVELTGRSDFVAVLALGLAYAATDQPLEARVTLERALALSPGHSLASRTLEGLEPVPDAEGDPERAGGGGQ